MPLFPPNKLYDDLIIAYNELVSARKSAIGYTVQDPTTGIAAIETEENMQALYLRVSTLLNGRIGKRSIRDRVVQFFKRDSDATVQLLIVDIEQVKGKYTELTYRRSQYGLLSPLAFGSLESLPTIMGDPTSDRVLSLKWCAQFQELSIEATDTGLLEVIGITNGGFLKWWFEDHPESGKQETSVWTDLKALALRLVTIFDKVDMTSETNFSMDCIHSICRHLRTSAISIAGLIYLHHERYNDILPLFELLVPSTYAFTVLLGVYNDANLRSKAVVFLEKYLATLDTQRSSLIAQLGADNEIELYLHSNSTTLASAPSPHLSISKQKNASTECRQAAVSNQLFQETIKELNGMGLKEIKIDVVRGGEPLGSGSFATVKMYHAETGSEKFAVKLFKRKKADLERTQNRLLREAAHWIKLSHKNVNTLLGFCIVPNEDFPGLVSPLCECPINDYLEEYAAEIDEKAKLYYLLDIAYALEYAHYEKNIVHGDVRPPNILLSVGKISARLIAKLNDFGVSYDKDACDKYDVTTMQHTNELYLAPELVPPEKPLKADITDKDAQVLPLVSMPGDVYAFGCCFLEIFYNKDPFYYNKSAVRKLKRNGSLPALQKDIRPQHWKFLQRVWSADVKKRPQATDLVNQMLIFTN